MKENRFETDNIEMIVGMYAAEDIRRHWTEDFLDETVGEIIQRDRSELIIERGTLITSDIASRISFHIQAGDIEKVEVTDVQRHRKGYFSLQSVASFKECIVIEKEFTEAELKDADGELIDRAFYQLDTVALWHYNDYGESHIFIALARDVDEAREQIEDWINSRASARMKEIAEAGNSEDEQYKRFASGFSLSVISGTKIPCTATVPVGFSKEYYTTEETESNK